MFTVKVQHADGAEELHEARSIRVIRGGAQVAGSIESRAPNYFADGIYLDPEVIHADAQGSGGEGELWGGRVVIQFGGDQTDSAQRRKGGKVWVMNEKGSTVATYDL